MVFTYDIHKTWQQNCDLGPQFGATTPVTGHEAAASKTFLGLSVRSRIGIAAGLLLNSRWIAGYAERGFDILTYKTVRSVARNCYPVPNWVFVDEPQSDDSDEPVYVCETPINDGRQISSSVCFGMPSVPPTVWREDVRRAKAALRDGQILVVSVVATPEKNATQDSVAADFAQCAAWAAESGADVIEANLSCPNVCSAEGTIYHDPTFSRLVAMRIRQSIGTTPLLLKLGLFDQLTTMHDFLRSVADFASGVTLVNCMIRPVLHRDGRPAFGPDFVRAGVLGRAIHKPSVKAVSDVVQFVAKEGLPMQVAAVGGVSCESDFADFFAAGAAAVLCGSSPMYLPDLAMKIKSIQPAW